MKIPFVHSAIEDARAARAAYKAKRYHSALLKGTGALATVTLPPFIGKAVYDSYREGKMKAEDIAKLKGSGFSKEAGLISGTLGAVGKFVKARPGIATGLAVGAPAGAAALYGGQKLMQAAGRRQQFGPQASYGGQFR